MADVDGPCHVWGITRAVAAYNLMFVSRLMGGSDAAGKYFCDLEAAAVSFQTALRRKGLSEAAAIRRQAFPRFKKGAVPNSYAHSGALRTLSSLIIMLR
jgi:hypothetical protein